MGSWPARILDLIPTAGRQYVPLNGIFADGWQPASAIAVYWVESMLLAAIAVVLCLRLKQRTSDRAIARARAEGDDGRAAALVAEQLAARGAGVDPVAVMAFHLGSLVVFGFFLGGVLLILTANHHIEPFDWTELREGAKAMMIVIALGFTLDLAAFPSLSVTAVQSRLEGCLRRWALLWLLGFVGTGLMMFTGRPGVFLGFFAVLKVTFEVTGALARLFGWKSQQERASAPST